MMSQKVGEKIMPFKLELEVGGFSLTQSRMDWECLLVSRGVCRRLIQLGEFKGIYLVVLGGI